MFILSTDPTRGIVNLHEKFPSLEKKKKIKHKRRFIAMDSILDRRRTHRGRGLKKK